MLWVTILSFVLGVALIYIIIAAIFRWLKFTVNLTTLLTAYTVTMIIVVLLGAIGSADGGPPNFQRAPWDIAQTICAFMFHWLYWRRSQ